MVDEFGKLMETNRDQYGNLYQLSMHGNRNLAQEQILVPQDKMYCMYSTEIVNNSQEPRFAQHPLGIVSLVL